MFTIPPGQSGAWPDGVHLHCDGVHSRRCVLSPPPPNTGWGVTQKIAALIHGLCCSGKSWGQCQNLGVVVANCDFNIISILSFQHTQLMDTQLIAITVARGPGITTQQMGTRAAIQHTQELLVTGVVQMVTPVILTCRQPLNLPRQWFSIQCVLGNPLPT